MASELETFFEVNTYAVHDASYDIDIHAEFEEILVILRTLVGASAREAEAAMLQGDPAKPLALFAELAERRNAPAAYHRYAAFLAFCVNKPDALPFLKDAFAADPENIALHWFYAKRLVGFHDEEAEGVLLEFVKAKAAQDMPFKLLHAYRSLANIYHRHHGDLERAIEMTLEELCINERLYREHTDRREELLVNSNSLGYFFGETGQVALSEELYQIAFSLAKSLKDYTAMTLEYFRQARGCRAEGRT